MDYITQIQNEYIYFTDMLKSIEKIKRKTPGNGFAKIVVRKKIATYKDIVKEMNLILEVIA